MVHIAVWAGWSVHCYWSRSTPLHWDKLTLWQDNWRCSQCWFQVHSLARVWAARMVFTGTLMRTVMLQMECSFKWQAWSCLEICRAFQVLWLWLVHCFCQLSGSCTHTAAGSHSFLHLMSWDLIWGEAYIHFAFGDLSHAFYPSLYSIYLVHLQQGSTQSHTVLLCHSSIRCARCVYGWLLVWIQSDGIHRIRKRSRPAALMFSLPEGLSCLPAVNQLSADSLSLLTLHTKLSATYVLYQHTV